MKQRVEINELFDCKVPYIINLFTAYKYPWEIIANIKSYITNLTQEKIKGFNEISDGVFAGENVKIYPSAVIESPAIIGEGTQIRPGAFLRGGIITGKNCVIGNSSELKNSILLDNVQIPHYNYVGDSILGNHAHMGAGSICSNLKADGKSIVIHGEKDFETGIRKIGAFLADGVDIGCGCVLNPGTIVGKNTSVYPLNSLRGVFPSDCIVKTQKEIVKRRVTK